MISTYKCSREANVSFRNSSHKAKSIYARADNNNPPGVAHNRKYVEIICLHPVYKKRPYNYN
jgi:hypothetical protein